MTIAGYDNSVTIGEMFAYLDDLRDGGSINMFGAGPYLREEFGLSRAESHEVLAAWQTTFDPSIKPEDRAATALEAAP